MHIVKKTQAYTKWVNHHFNHKELCYYPVLNLYSLNPLLFANYATKQYGSKAKVVGVRNTKDYTFYEAWDFSHGVGCLKRVQEAMRVGKIMLNIEL